MSKFASNAFRVISLTEGASFLFLLFIAMPFKYMADQPEWVAIGGMVHGALFTLYIPACIFVTVLCRWRWTKLLLAFVAAFVPFGPFLFDKWIDRR